MKIVGAIVMTLGIFGLVGIIAVLLAYPTMWAVNYLVAPAILSTLFGVGQLTLWKAFALNVVLSLFHGYHGYVRSTK